MMEPTPSDLSQAPNWQNYVVAQAVAASLGQLSVNTLGYGVKTEEASVTLRFQMRQVDEQDRENISDIASELEALLGAKITVVTEIFQGTEFHIAPARPDERWIYLAQIST